MKKLSAAVVAATSLFTLAAHAEDAAKKPTGKVKRGEYLVTITGCNDCHTPIKMTPKGPQPDMEHMLSGHPQDLKMPPAPAAQGPWVSAVSGTMTAWSTPMGLAFSSNLTPDKETGLGAWTEQNFIDTIRSGRHLGKGRAVMLPMPWFNYAKMTDEDLKAVYAYLQSIPAVKNKVPAPVAPPQQAAR